MTSMADSIARECPYIPEKNILDQPPIDKKQFVPLN